MSLREERVTFTHNSQNGPPPEQKQLGLYVIGEEGGNPGPSCHVGMGVVEASIFHRPDRRRPSLDWDRLPDASTKLEVLQASLLGTMGSQY